MEDRSGSRNSRVMSKSRNGTFRDDDRRRSVCLTPTTLFSDCHIVPTEEYKKVVDPQRRRLLFVLLFFVLIAPLMFRYACGSSNERGVDSTTIPWGSGVDGWEWSVMVVLWLGILGSIFRLLPMVAGRPAAVESSQRCRLDGMAALGLVSPFSSEDDAILLRSLLGRTCTAFHTIGSRHSMQGLYVDCVLNERRIKGEANRRNCWLAWMKFLNALVDVALLMKEEAIITPETGCTPVTSFRAVPPPPPPRPSPPTAPESPIQKAPAKERDHYLPVAPQTEPRALYVQGSVTSAGVTHSTAQPRRASGMYNAVPFPTIAPPPAPPSGPATQNKPIPAAAPTQPKSAMQPTFRDIRASLDTAMHVSAGTRSRLSSWSKDKTGGRPLSVAMTHAQTPAASDSVAPISHGPTSERDLMQFTPRSPEDLIVFTPQERDLITFSDRSGGSRHRSYRALYVSGSIGLDGVATPEPFSKRDSWGSIGDSGPSTHGGVLFKAVGMGLESTVGVGEPERSRITSWTRDDYNNPLSYGMLMATPRKHISFREHYDVFSDPSHSNARSGNGSAEPSVHGLGRGGRDTPEVIELLAIDQEAPGDIKGPPELMRSTSDFGAQRSLRTGESTSVGKVLSNRPMGPSGRMQVSFTEAGSRKGAGASDREGTVMSAGTSARVGGLRTGTSTPGTAGVLRFAPSVTAHSTPRDYMSEYSDSLNQDLHHRGDWMAELERESDYHEENDNGWRSEGASTTGFEVQWQSSAGQSPSTVPNDGPLSWSERSARMAQHAATTTQQIMGRVHNAATDFLSKLETPASPSGDAEIGSPTAVELFPMTPSDRPRSVTTKQSQMASSYLRPHGIPNLELNMADIVPMIDFLDSWLDEMKENEWTYDYHKPRSALEKLFFACPFMSHFKGHHMLAVHAALDTLYTAFTDVVKDEPDPKRPYHPDEVSEVEWVLRRQNLPDWSLLWTYASRARLRELPRQNINDPHGPDPVYQSTRIKPGAIVYRLPPKDVLAECVPMAYFRTRRSMYKVDYIKPANGKLPAMAYLIPFSPTVSSSTSGAPSDLETGSGNAGNFGIHAIIPVDELVLLEKNRGKTGALNFFNDYLRAKTFKFARSHGMRRPIQTFTGILDARHALVETDIFWNDALPYFARVETTGKPGKRFGGLTEHSICITVQYPQFFTNVGSDDVLDNTNSTYYNLWQTLRDGAKCICSSGTNAIWDISNPAFEFCTTSRSEDLGTSHEYIPHCAAVYLCIYVAFGIAKKTEDFLEALYRWSAGPLELLWPSFFQWKIFKHYIYVGIPTTIMALASFNESDYWYWAYLFMVILFILKGCLDRLMGRKPLRGFIVSTVISINLFIVCSNLMSVMWLIVFPTRIAFFGVLPLGRTDEQGIFWAWISVFVSLSTGIVHDALIRIARHTAPGTKHLNYDNCLWRGSQLYANSFMFTLLATIAGSWSAYKAWMWDYDLSMWTSFRVSQSEYDKLNKGVEKESFCSLAFLTYLWNYTKLYGSSCLAALTMPTVMTKWYVSCVFLLQFVCIGVSTFIVNRDTILVLAVLWFSCTLNIFMTGEVAMLLQPWFHIPLGFPFRWDYGIVLFGLVVLGYCAAQGALSYDSVFHNLHLGPFVSEIHDLGAAKYYPP